MSGGLVTRPASWIRPMRVVRRKGSRIGVVADFQLVCGAGPFELDVLVREMEAPSGIELAGQVTRAGSIHDPVDALQLSLIDADGLDVVRRTSTDAFGEFDLESGRPGLFGLRLGEGEDSPCVFVWEEE